MDIIEVNGMVYFTNIQWKDIIINSINTGYEVNNIGQVRNKSTGKILSSYTDKDGYVHTTIFINKKQYHPGVHRFVATAFIPNPENKPQVNHKNGVKNDNNVENLEWVTNQENVQHAFDTGLKKSILGEDNVLSKYTKSQIEEVCELLEKEIPNKLISEITGVDRKYITDIKKGRRWKHISSKYNIKKSKYPKELILAIDELILAGYDSTKDIIESLLLDNTESISSLIRRRKYLFKSFTSTTIDHR